MADEQHDDVTLSSKTLREWREQTYDPALRKAPERDDPFTTSSSMPVEPLYGPDEHDDGLGFPGEYPYTRGVQPTMYRAKPWTMRMFAGFGTAEETNERFKYLLQQGQTGLSCAFDMATLYGYDHDHPMA
ncbi:MAG TPA: methylmalonyl-CoA mutase family protein, partial [Ktedonobacterales bacterium]|nr:methylmalonyl-CoA mutase family protein [Ktedonobacterales bacterium]